MKTKKKHEPWTGAWFLELAVIIAVALGLALGIQAFLVKPYRIPSPSMVPSVAATLAPPPARSTHELPL